MLKTSDINAALRRFYKTTEYALMFEVADSTGANSHRRADAVAMNLWPSRGLYIEGIEVKVSRSDWRKELDTPSKSWPVPVGPAHGQRQAFHPHSQAGTQADA
jgi:hypothetical protein